MDDAMFSPINIGNIFLKNRIVRSATYEGASDASGFPGPDYLKLYENLAKNEVGLLITGFSFIDKFGRAMQPHQSGIDSKDKIQYFKKLNAAVHKYDCPIIIQLAHAGRQTLESVIGTRTVSSTKKQSVYFRQKPKLLTKEEIYEIAEKFAVSAHYAQSARFDGVQFHSAHGYLLHQFILPETNKLGNEFGIDPQTGIGTYLLKLIINKTRKYCGNNFPIIVKISGDHDLSNNFFPDQFNNLIIFLNAMEVSAIEISYGTMDYAMNIFRGDIDLDLLFKENPLFITNSKIKRTAYATYINSVIKPKLKKFSRMYNLDYADAAKKITNIPIISVGGFSTKKDIEYAISSKKTDLVGMSRPFICEPDFVLKLKNSNDNCSSKCTHCNKCVIMCDSDQITKCYRVISNNKIQIT